MQHLRLIYSSVLSSNLHSTFNYSIYLQIHSHQDIQQGSIVTTSTSNPLAQGNMGSGHNIMSTAPMQTIQVNQVAPAQVKNPLLNTALGPVANQSQQQKAFMPNIIQSQVMGSVNVVTSNIANSSNQNQVVQTSQGGPIIVGNPQQHSQAKHLQPVLGVNQQVGQQQMIVTNAGNINVQQAIPGQQQVPTMTTPQQMPIATTIVGGGTPIVTQAGQTVQRQQNIYNIEKLQIELQEAYQKEIIYQQQEITIPQHGQQQQVRSQQQQVHHQQQSGPQMIRQQLTQATVNTVQTGPSQMHQQRQINQQRMTMQQQTMGQQQVQVGHNGAQALRNILQQPTQQVVLRSMPQQQMPTQVRHVRATARGPQQIQMQQQQQQQQHMQHQQQQPQPMSQQMPNPQQWNDLLH